jgi:pimeloyl-ACP methyl ester carboxylesterase
MKQIFVNVSGLNIRYLDAGTNVVCSDAIKSLIDHNADGSSIKDHVLFIHGLGSSAERWLDIPDALSLLNLHAVAMDLPGFGLSDKPAEMDYTIGKFVEVVSDFMGKVGMEEGKTMIVGHSLGGYIAAQLAVEHRSLVTSLF